MNINSLHLLDYTPVRKNIENELETDIYFFGVNILEITYNVYTGNIYSIILNQEEANINDSKQMAKLKSHIDNYGKEMKNVDYSKIDNLHISGFNRISNIEEKNTNVSITVDNKHYLIVYNNNTGKILKIMENEKEISTDSKSIEMLNNNFDKIRLNNYMKSSEN